MSEVTGEMVEAGAKRFRELIYLAVDGCDERLVDEIYQAMRALEPNPLAGPSQLAMSKESSER